MHVIEPHDGDGLNAAPAKAGSWGHIAEVLPPGRHDYICNKGHATARELRPSLGDRLARQC